LSEDNIVVGHKHSSTGISKDEDDAWQPPSHPVGN